MSGIYFHRDFSRDFSREISAQKGRCFTLRAARQERLGVPEFHLCGRIPASFSLLITCRRTGGMWIYGQTAYQSI